MFFIDVEEIGYMSHTYAELACRTDCNMNDVRQSLQDLGVTIEDLFTYSNYSNELPFAFGASYDQLEWAWP